MLARWRALCGVTAMVLDTLYIVLSAVLFALTWGFMLLCERV
jgi:hypothetical protein